MSPELLMIRWVLLVFSGLLWLIVWTPPRLSHTLLSAAIFLKLWIVLPSIGWAKTKVCFLFSPSKYVTGLFETILDGKCDFVATFMVNNILIYRYCMAYWILCRLIDSGLCPSVVEWLILVPAKVLKVAVTITALVTYKVAGLGKENHISSSWLCSRNKLTSLLQVLLNFTAAGHLDHCSNGWAGHWHCWGHCPTQRWQLDCRGIGKERNHHFMSMWRGSWPHIKCTVKQYFWWATTSVCEWAVSPAWPAIRVRKLPPTFRKGGEGIRTGNFKKKLPPTFRKRLRGDLNWELFNFW